MELYIKNMVCPRCIIAVKEILQQQGITPIHIQLGRVITSNELTNSELINLQNRLTSIGFELLNDSQKQTVEQIKNLILEHIYKEHDQAIAFSEYLSQKLSKDYSSLSKLFSSLESITIEQYTIQQKVERIKELLSYDQLTLSEIAHQMGYSSVAHISSQFKRITGMTPSQFKIQGIR